MRAINIATVLTENHQSHVIDWLDQLDDDHPAKLRLAIRDAEVAHMADMFEFLTAEDDLRDGKSSETNPTSGIPSAALVVADSKSARERQARRYKACEDAGLTMPRNDYASLPRGIGAIAKAEGISRQAFAEDVKAHIRLLNAK